MSDLSASPWRIPLFAPDFGPAELEAVRRPIEDGWLTMGPQVARLEESWAAHTGAKHAVAVANGTAALHLAALAAGLGVGDEMLCPTLTFVASANAARYVGARPVFVESKGPDDLNLDPQDCLRKITPRTKAIMAVHYAGFPADMEALLAIAREHGLVLIEDSAHAVFSRTEVHGRARMCGSIGQTATFSLFSNKNVTCGEGGLITTDDDELVRRLRLWRSHGMTAPTLDRHLGRAVSYDVVAVGYNARLDEIHAALALAQLARVREFLWARHRLFREYRGRLESLPVTVPFAGRPEFASDRPVAPTEGLGVEAAALPPTGVHILSILLPEHVDRRAVMDRLKQRGVQTSIHYPPIHLFESFQQGDQGRRGALPRTEALADRQLTLPFYPTMKDEEIDLVVGALAEALPIAARTR